MSVSDAKDGETETESISSIISFLKSAFRPGDFVKAERMLKSREEELISEKDALEIELKKRLDELGEIRKNAVDAEKELEIYRTKCSQLEMELEKKNKDCFAISIKLGDFEFRNVSLLEELEVYKRRCDGLKQQIRHLEEDRNVVCKRESKAQERIVGLSEELWKMERSEKGKYADLQRENKDLELAKSRRDREIERWKKRRKELETRVSRLEEETSALTRMEQQLFGNTQVEPVSLPNGDKDESKMSKTECETNDGIKVCLSESPLKEKTSSNQEIQTSAKAGSTCPHTPLKGSNCLQVAEGPPSTNMPCKPLFSVKKEKVSISSESDVEYGSRVRKQQVFKEGCSNKNPSISKMDIVKPILRGIIDISDSDSETELIPKNNSKYRGDYNMAHIPLDHALEEAMDDEQERTSQKRLKRSHSDGKAEENWSSHGGDFSLAERARGNAAPKIATSDNENMDNKTPISKLKMKKLQDIADGIHKPIESQVNNCFLAPTTSLNDENAEENINLKQPLIPLRHCKDKNRRAERNFANHLENSGTLHVSRIPASGDAKRVGSENKMEIFCKYDDSDSEDSSSNSDDAWGNDSAISQVFSNLIRMKKQKKLRWQYECEMVSSFEADPELCLMAVCALYRQQTSDKKLMKDSLHSNNRGFSKFDVLRGNLLAEFLMGENKKGDLKKSVKELEMHDPKGLEECRRLAIRYSSQLFSIYQSREDPFFLSS